MKLDKQSVIVGLAIGVIVGGGLIGYLDANRPKPLFSSANYGGGDDPCSPEIRALLAAYRTGSVAQINAAQTAAMQCFSNNPYPAAGKGTAE